MAPVLFGAVKLLLMAQATQATVAGTVRDDETGQPLAGVIVALPELNRSTATDAEGRYWLREVPTGSLRLTIRFIGHAPRTLSVLVPPSGRIEINLALHPIPVMLARMDVRPPVAVRGSEHDEAVAFPDRVISIAAVRNDPMLAEPDVLQALGGGNVVLKPEVPSGIQIRGGASDQTAYLLDGIPVFSPYHAAGLFSAWNPDALSSLHLSSAATSPAHPGVLSGTVVAETRAPGERVTTQGSVSSTQARLTLDGPLGVAGAGFLFSARSGFPGFFAPKHDPAYLRGGSSDWLATLEAPAFGGRIRALGYDSDNEVNSVAAAEQPAGTASQDAPRNTFEWHSRSLGAEWRRLVDGGGVRIQTWSAAADARSVWIAHAGPMALTAARHDEGILATLERRSARASVTFGLRIEQIRTSYRIAAESAAVPSWSLPSRTPVATLFGEQAGRLSRRIQFTLGTSVAVAQGELRLAPRGQLQWAVSDRLAIAGGYARSLQFAQSLRNPESVVGNVFPADLYVSAGAPGIPVAQSDQSNIHARYRASSSMQVSAEGYQRSFEGLLLVAPRTGEPFSTGAFAIGTGGSHGVSVDASVSTARYGLVARYGWQRVWLEYGDSSYSPEHGTTHLFEGGVIVFPGASFSIRVGAAAALGRHATRVTGGFGSESCNLLDRGCEFGGSPNHSGQALGGTGLPGYFRIDLGIRKLWQVRIGGRDGALALFGTITNLFNRKNVLTYAGDPSAGQSAEVDLRPRAPLVAGLDWRF